MKPQVGDLRTVTQRFDGEQWVLCLQSMPPRELSDEELLLELFSRHEAGIAPTTRKYYGGTWVSYVIGVGKNHSVAIEVTKEDIEALKKASEK